MTRTAPLAQSIRIADVCRAGRVDVSRSGLFKKSKQRRTSRVGGGAGSSPSFGNFRENAQNLGSDETIINN